MCCSVSLNGLGCGLDRHGHQKTRVEFALPFRPSLSLGVAASVPGGMVVSSLAQARSTHQAHFRTIIPTADVVATGRRQLFS